MPIQTLMVHQQLQVHMNIGRILKAAQQLPTATYILFVTVQPTHQSLRSVMKPGRPFQMVMTELS